MELFTVVIPRRRMLVFDVSYGSFYCVQLVEMIDRLTEKFEITMKQYFGEHELLIDRQAVFDLFYPLEIVNKTWTALTCGV